MIVLHEGAAELANRMGVCSAGPDERFRLISLSHSSDYAVANAVLIKQETGD